jgi:hypothetical protein
MSACPECGEPMAKHLLPGPGFWLFKRLEICWWSYTELCENCIDEQDQRNRRRMDDAAFDAGFEKGWKAREHDPWDGFTYY